MAKGKCTYQVGKSAEGGRTDYVYAVNIEYTFKDVK